MWERVRDILFTPHPYERDVLLLLAWCRACFVTATGILAFWLIWFSGFPLWSRITLVVLGVPVGAFLTALISADFLEHYSCKWVLGWTVNPRMKAKNELEGGMFPDLTTEHPESALLLTLWEHHKFDIVYFKVRPGDTLILRSLGYEAEPGTFFRCLWEGDPQTGYFGAE